jgi:dihydrofolate reductase
VNNYVYIAASLDGYIATPDGGVEWLNGIPNPDQTDYGYAEFMSGIDALIMGRKTFEQVLTFGHWPYEKPVFVLSSRLSEVPEQLQGKVEILSGEIVELVEKLNKDGYNSLYIDGGKVITTFLNQDLIDEMIITTVPILLGGGISLFGQLDRPMYFVLVDSKTYSNSLVINHYKRARNET